MPGETARHSEGIIRRRGSRWQVDMTVAGRRVRRAAPTYEAAQEILAELSSSNSGHNGKALAALVNGVTVAEILQRYLQSTRLHCRPRTIRTSEGAWDHSPRTGTSLACAPRSREFSPPMRDDASSKAAEIFGPFSRPLRVRGCAQPNSRGSGGRTSTSKQEPSRSGPSSTGARRRTVNATCQSPTA